MNVAGRRYVVVVLDDFVFCDNLTKLINFFPFQEGVSYLFLTFFSDVVLRIAFLKFKRSIDQKYLVLPALWLILVEKQHYARRGGIVEQVFRQIQDSLNQILLDKPHPDGFLLVA